MCVSAAASWRLYRRVLGYYRADRLQLLFLIALIGVGTALGLLSVWPLALLVDTVLAAAPSGGRFADGLLSYLPDGRVHQLILLATATLLLRWLQEGLQALRTVVNIGLANRALLRVRCDLFHQLQALSVQYHHSQPQGDAIHRLINDTPGFQGVLDVLIGVCVAAVTMLIILGIMLSRNVALTLVAMSVVPLLVATNLGFASVLRNLSRTAKQEESRYVASVQRAMRAVGLVQLCNREAWELERFHEVSRRHVASWTRFHWSVTGYRLCVGAILAAGTAGLFGVGGYLVARDQFLHPVAGGMTVGDLVLFISYLGMLYDPLCRLTGAATDVRHAASGAERVFEVLDRHPGVADRPDAVSLPLQPRHLALRGVGFAYDRGEPVLDGVDLSVAPGEMVAVVGRSGTGKSTLLHLLPRFYDPGEGCLELDGIDLRGIRLRDLRRHVAVVLQNPAMLATTIGENIGYGRAGATPQEIREAARLAGAAEFIERLPGGYDFEVAEEGHNLSGGQRQRIALARALLSGAPILVLDEPTSALDPEHERQVIDTLRNLKGCRTIIIVSHRLSTVVDCDRIYVLDAGRVAEQGTHADLSGQQRLYWRMARHQLEAAA